MCSPCIDAGDPAFNSSDWAYDVDMGRRIVDVRRIFIPGRGPIDIGADEVLCWTPSYVLLSGYT
jgi:hypothetical protein